MKPGSLVVMIGFKYPSQFQFGIIVRESKRTNSWGDKTHRWWEVLRGNKIIHELEAYLKPIE